MKRGELWVAAGPGYLSKPRPVLILQDDRYGQTASVTVAPLTSERVDAPLWRVEIGATPTSGLDRASYVRIDKVTTTRRSHLAQPIGQVTPAQLRDVERLLLAFLGLAS